MPVELNQMRDLLLPGLMEMVQSYSFMKEEWESEMLVDNLLVKGYERYSYSFDALPPAPLPIGPRAALAMGVAAVVVKNPEVSRRGLFRFWK